MLFVITGAILGCSAPYPGSIKLIGHGGLGPDAEYPMDSPEAIMAALDLGLQGVELDVQLSASGELVAFHDLEVAAGSCAGPINAFQLNELADCLGRPAASLQLTEILSEANRVHPNAEFTLDVKLNTKGDWWNYLNSFCTAIARLDSLPELRGKVLVECRTTEFLSLLHERSPQIPLYLYADEAQQAIAQAVELGCAGITLHTDHVSADHVVAARSAGLSITLFGVEGNFALRGAIGKQPDRIQVDQ